MNRSHCVLADGMGGAQVSLFFSAFYVFSSSYLSQYETSEKKQTVNNGGVVGFSHRRDLFHTQQKLNGNGRPTKAQRKAIKNFALNETFNPSLLCAWPTAAVKNCR